MGAAGLILFYGLFQIFLPFILALLICFLTLNCPRVKSLAAQLAKINIAAQKREEVEKEKVVKIQEALESKLSAADENKAKVLSDVKDKVGPSVRSCYRS